MGWNVIPLPFMAQHDLTDSNIIQPSMVLSTSELQDIKVPIAPDPLINGCTPPSPEGQWSSSPEGREMCPSGLTVGPWRGHPFASGNGVINVSLSVLHKMLK